MQIESGRFTVRLAESEQDLKAAQALRYEVFVKELGAGASDEEHALERELDGFDAFCDHLLLIDTLASDRAVVGVYRLLPCSVALGKEGAPGPGFYTATEYDLSPLASYPRQKLELGRSCVAKDYRGTAAMQLLWIALSQYVAMHDIGLLFGTASFHGTDPEAFKIPLSYLHHNHLAPPHLRPRALPDRYVSMDMTPADAVDRVEAMRALPALMKGYMRIGGFVGDGAYVDHTFNTVDVCFVMDTTRITSRYRKFYARRAPADLARVLG